MKQEYLHKAILDHIGSIIYVANIEDYTLYYLNAVAKNMFGFAADDESYVGQKCYKVFQGRDEPCEFCVNCLLEEDKFYEWEYYNPMVEDYFFIKDTLICHEGMKARLEIAELATNIVEERKSLMNMLETERVLNQCVQTLADTNEMNQAVEQLLEIIAEFYGADRAYIYEINYKNKTTSNLYEWCKEEVHSVINYLHELQIEDMQYWLDEFAQNGQFCISRLDECEHTYPQMYRILAEQGIHSLMAVPLISSDKIIGFLGVDNPVKNIHIFELLKTVTYFIVNDFDKRRSLREFKRLSYSDTLTGIYNRNKYNKVLSEMQSIEMDNVGVVYADLNGLKKANDVYGHIYGDNILITMANILKEVFGKNIFRIGGDEFVVISVGISRITFEQSVLLLRRLVQSAKNLEASIGSDYKERGTDILKQIINADKNMYIEKQQYYAEKEI